MAPKIDFSGLSLGSSPGSGVWESVRAQVMDALVGHGFFEAVSDKLSRQRWDDAFGGPMDEAFGVPTANKTSTRKGKAGTNYFAADMYEILTVDNPTDPASVEAYTRSLHPEGIPSFSKMVVDMSKDLAALEMMVRRMIFEALNIEKHFEAHLESTQLKFRMVKYNPFGDEAPSMQPHTDMNVLTIVYQHGEDGLEIHTDEGHWYRAPPYACVVFIAETLKVLTNGRLKPTMHRVNVASEGTRYSVGFSSQLVGGYELEAPEELVDEEHPRLYKRFEFESYMYYRVTEAGLRSGDPLKDYCGVDGPADTVDCLSV